MKTITSWFYHGAGFPLLVMAAVFFGYTYPLYDLPVFIVLSAIAAVGLLSFDAIEVMIPMAFMQFYVVNVEHGPNVPNYSDYYTRPAPFFMILCGGIILFSALAVYCVRHFKTRNRLPVRVRLVGYTLLLLSLTLIMNGRGSSHDTGKGVGFGMGLAVAFLFFYFLFAYFMPHTAKTRDLVMKCAALTELLLALQTLVIYQKYAVIENGHVLKHTLVNGWGTNNSLGGMLVMMMPACFYLAAKKKYGLIYFFIGLFGYVAAILTMSRNAWLIGTATLVLSFLCFLIFSPHRRRVGFISLVTVIGIAAFAVAFREELAVVFWQNIQNGLSDNGRYDIWRYAYDQFLSAFWHGTGFYDSYPPVGDWQFEVFPYLVHNTWLQMLASCGIVGFGAYLLHRLVSTVTSLRKLTLFRLFAGLSVLALLLMSLLDVYLFLVYPTIAYSIFLVFIGYDAADPKEDRLFGRRKKKKIKSASTAEAAK